MDSRYATWAARWRVPLGFMMAIAFAILSQPTVRLILIGGGIAMSGLGLRALAAGYLEKGTVLATNGPYRYTRNPLYLGSFLMGVGFAVAADSWVLGLAFLGFFLLIYWPVMRREEEALRRSFGEAFDQYANSTALFFPGFSTKSKTHDGIASVEQFRWKRYQKNHEYEAALGYIAGLGILVAKLILR